MKIPSRMNSILSKMETARSLRGKLVESYLKSPSTQFQFVPPDYIYGEKYARLEALMRPFHLISTEPDLESSKFASYITYFNSELDAILNPESNSYFGNIQGFDSSINEAANLAFHFWLNDKAWNVLTQENRALFLNWIKDVHSLEVKKNNWVLFRGLLAAFFSEKSETPLKDQAISDFSLATTWIRTDGWVTDGHNGNVDFYTGFVFYPFLLLGVYKNILNKRKSALILNGLKQWGSELEQLSDSCGRLPLFGRSLIYRFSFISPFIVSQKLFGIQFLSPDLLNRIILNFQFDRITNNGILNFGVYDERPEVRESYSTSASPYWLARGLLQDIPANTQRKACPEAKNSCYIKRHHEVINVEGRTCLINVNSENPNSIYFQNIIESENGWIKLSSFGNIQKLSLRRFRIRWKNIVLPTVESENPNRQIHNVYFLLPRFSIIRIGWNNSVRIKYGLKIFQSNRVSRHHLWKSNFIFKEHILFSLLSSKMSLQLSAP